MVNRGHGAAVSEMAYDNLQILPCLAEQLCRPRRYVVMACTVESVTAHLVLLIILVWKPVQISLLGHCLVKCRVKYCHHRHIRHNFPARVDSDKVCRIVERRKVVTRLDCLQHFVIDDNGAGEFLAAVHNAVPDCIDFIQRLDYAVAGIRKRVNHKLHSHGMIRHRRLDSNLVLSGRRMREHASVDADALAEPFCEHCLGFAVNELVLK